MEIDVVEAAVKQLITVMERDRETAIQRSPIHRRDFDNALSAVQLALEHIRHGRIEVARNMWTRNVALKALSRNYDEEFARVSTALQ